MEAAAIVELVNTVGFPIAIVAVLLWFVFKMQQDSIEREETIRQDAKERETQLYSVINSIEDKLNDVAMTLVKVTDVLTSLTDRVSEVENKLDRNS